MQWRLILTVGQPDDPTDDATIPWPEGREQVDAGTLTLDAVESEATGNGSRHQLRSFGVTGRNLAVRRSFAQRPIGSLFKIVHKTGGRKERAERDHAFGRAKVSVRMTMDPQQFPVSMRFLHWLMAAMVLAMLGIGVAMVASLGDYHWLVSIHRPVGIVILILVVVRFVNRRFSTLPPFPATMSSQERFIAHMSEMLLYTLLLVQPLVGWGMLSAARYPIALLGRCIFSPSFRIA